MERKQQHQEIIGRIEDIRLKVNRNRTQFCRAFGMKPQTYNNFIGSQGSKPNIDLILGVVQAWKANPMWVLTGQGRMFQDGAYNPIMDPPRLEPADLHLERVGEITQTLPDPSPKYTQFQVGVAMDPDTYFAPAGPLTLEIPASYVMDGYKVQISLVRSVAQQPFEPCDIHAPTDHLKGSPACDLQTRMEHTEK